MRVRPPKWRTISNLENRGWKKKARQKTEFFSVGKTGAAFLMHSSRRSSFHFFVREGKRPENRSILKNAETAREILLAAGRWPYFYASIWKPVLFFLFSYNVKHLFIYFLSEIEEGEKCKIKIGENNKSRQIQSRLLSLFVVFSRKEKRI